MIGMCGITGNIMYSPIDREVLREEWKRDLMISGDRSGIFFILIHNQFLQLQLRKILNRHYSFTADVEIPKTGGRRVCSAWANDGGISFMYREINYVLFFNYCVVIIIM